MSVSKVVYNGTVLIDITDSTVTPEDLEQGIVAYNAKGEKIFGMKALDTAMSNTSENGVQNKVIKSYVDGITGDLTSLNTTAKDTIVDALNELKFGVDAAGEPFRIVNWAKNDLNVVVQPCTTDASNTALDKMTFKITGQEAIDYQVTGLLAYEVFDAVSGGNRINAWPVCQFTGQGQTELSVRWVGAGTTQKTIKRINGWVLLKHR